MVRRACSYQIGLAHKREESYKEEARERKVTECESGFFSGAAAYKPLVRK